MENVQTTLRKRQEAADEYRVRPSRSLQVEEKKQTANLEQDVFNLRKIIEERQLDHSETEEGQRRLWERIGPEIKSDSLWFVSGSSSSPIARFRGVAHKIIGIRRMGGLDHLSTDNEYQRLPDV